MICLVRRLNFILETQVRTGRLQQMLRVEDRAVSQPSVSNTAVAKVVTLDQMELLVPVVAVELLH
jgi:hypothetical protein